jgi:CRP-like cAMP-binding protein
MRKLDKAGRIFYTKNGIPRLKRYLDEAKGMPMQDVWTDIEALRQRYPRISDVFIEALLRLVQRLTTQVSELSELDSSTRLYRQLWRLGDVYEKRRVGAEIPISQQQLHKN